MLASTKPVFCFVFCCIYTRLPGQYNTCDEMLLPSQWQYTERGAWFEAAVARWLVLIKPGLLVVYIYIYPSSWSIQCLWWNAITLTMAVYQKRTVWSCNSMLASTKPGFLVVYKYNISVFLVSTLLVMKCDRVDSGSVPKEKHCLKRQ